ncbi:MAG: hypothetical protein RMM08_13350, partial [Armatimonadota bacterium]|nr:hypothetical protein [Armatimonadota bacterium]
MPQGTSGRARRPLGGEPLLGVIAAPVKQASARADDVTAMLRAGIRWVQLDIPLSRINPRA